MLSANAAGVAVARPQSDGLGGLGGACGGAVSGPPLKTCWKPGELHQPPALLASPVGGAPMLWHVAPACGDAGEQWGGSAGPDLAGNPAHIAGKEHGEVGTLGGLKKGGWFLPCDLPGGFSGEGGAETFLHSPCCPWFWLCGTSLCLSKVLLASPTQCRYG